MKIESISAKRFRRFRELTLTGLGPDVKLVVVVGPNGSGKTALFDVLVQWHRRYSPLGHGSDLGYYRYGEYLSSAERQRIEHRGEEGSDVVVAVHGRDVDSASPLTSTAVRARTAHRSDADFTFYGLQDRSGQGNLAPVSRMIDPDRSVSTNYQALLGRALKDLFSREPLLTSELVEKLVGPTKASLERVFPGLSLFGLGDPTVEGSFFFSKGQIQQFHYKNLSAGEKSVFDLLLDIHMASQLDPETVFLIDEPEVHTNARVQRLLLREIYEAVPDLGQLWIATHSVGMLREAYDLYRTDQRSVAFISFFDVDFDGEAQLEPVAPTRELFREFMRESLDDIADLVAPDTIVFCEGNVADGFDAACLRRIFSSEFPETDFVGVGDGANGVVRSQHLSTMVMNVSRGTKVIRVVDRDDKSDEEVSELIEKDVRVLGRRELENYLLDPEVVGRFVQSEQQTEIKGEILEILENCIKEARESNGVIVADEVKDATGSFLIKIKRLIDLTGRASNSRAFLRDVLAPNLMPGMKTYDELRESIFGIPLMSKVGTKVTHIAVVEQKTKPLA